MNEFKVGDLVKVRNDVEFPLSYIDCDSESVNKVDSGESKELIFVRKNLENDKVYKVYNTYSLYTGEYISLVDTETNQIISHPGKTTTFTTTLATFNSKLFEKTI